MVIWSKMDKTANFPSMEKVGMVVIAVITFQSMYLLLRHFYTNSIRPIIKGKFKVREMGQWAAITGACEGLGKAYAFALAKQGLDIILITRSEKKALSLAAEIEATYRMHTHIIEADLDTDNAMMYEDLRNKLRRFDVGVLVNNMCTSYPHPEYFLDLPHRERIYAAIINCNVGALTHLTRIVLPAMVRKGKGVIINVSSTAALIPCPLLTVFAASKAYIEKFSEDLATEYEPRGIVIQCLTPGYITGTSRESWIVPSPERYVNEALMMLGEETVTTAYLPHSLLVFLINLLKSISPSFAGRAVLRGMEIIRCRALQRYLI